MGNTLSLGSQARTTTDRQVAQRAAQLDAYEASLRKALAQKPPALPPVPVASASSAPLQAAAPVRVVYHRPPPIVITKHRVGGEHEGELEGAEPDD
jgi:outer membrane protein TolC